MQKQKLPFSQATLDKVPILGQRQRHGMFFLGGQCPVCSFPIFVHTELGDGVKGPVHTPMAFCQHDGMELELRVPTADNPEEERDHLARLFGLVYQQQDALAAAMDAAQTWERLYQEGQTSGGRDSAGGLHHSEGDGPGQGDAAHADSGG